MTVSKMAALGALMLACILLVWMVVGSREPATETQGVAAAVKGQTYEDAGLGFAFEFPADWVKTDTPELGADATFLGPRRSDLTMSLDIRSDDTPTALGVYVDRSIKKVLPEYRTDFRLLEEPTMMEGTVSAMKMAYSYREGAFDLTNVQAVYALPNRKIILSFCLLSEHYEKLKPVVENTFKSFRQLR